MSDRRNVLTPEALTMVDLIARTGSFAAAARELGKVPSALTYSVRQLEDALDVLLFDRSSRQAKLTAAGEELLHEGRRLLLEIDAVANRVKRVATGWETQLTVAVDNILAPTAVFELVEAFYTLRVATRHAPDSPPPTRLRLRSEVLSGTWEVLATGRADLAIGLAGDPSQGSSGIRCEPLGSLDMRFAVAPHHALAALPEPLSAETIAAHRVVAIADSAHSFAPMTLGVQPGQDVLTVPSLAAKLEALLRGLGCGSMPEPLLRRHAEAGRLVIKQTTLPTRNLGLHYAWHAPGNSAPGLALQWWLSQLRSGATQRALLEQHAGLVL
ncbi:MULTISPECIES: LysR substrate-binding domain-containing protein [Methylibium]|uniref:Transcriptional regulator, LysR family n=1 Tax=Methylibium petroleiphilum (strain ATCC BAA-1232 / LMG 22953 / PM1) TaxID=420662 RepID=A2SJV4_METPP|nr:MULTISPECIES: LysR substrate-binding domain-containing protein [Methylibium]ABM95843.1 transcriptional regulator, LysR family [Methylibium petroleiphilum PM1]EWS54997.1 HTH-type transcriptional activator AllS [Methylibium sp. T29]EWS59292.1 HTH-type transcriptional activator AllS [Methylibium sp. T29-B]